MTVKRDHRLILNNRNHQPTAQFSLSFNKICLSRKDQTWFSSALFFPDNDADAAVPDPPVRAAENNSNSNPTPPLPSPESSDSLRSQASTLPTTLRLAIGVLVVLVILACELVVVPQSHCLLSIEFAPSMTPSAPMPQELVIRANSPQTLSLTSPVPSSPPPPPAPETSSSPGAPM